jgi:hypothetical protein
MAFPSKGDRVAQAQYGNGTVMDIDTFHTVIEFDTAGTRRFSTSMVVLAPTSDQGPSAVERREAAMARAREERKQRRAEAGPRVTKRRGA